MLTIAVSSRSLFHLEESNQIFENEGQAAFDRHMEAHENDVLQPGCAFSLVKKLLALNTPGPNPDRVSVVLLSRNSASSSVRIMKSIRAHELPIDKAVFTSGGDRFRYAQEYGADLFLSATVADAKTALENGVAAATILPGARMDCMKEDGVVRIAFDGDAVIFSDESDAVFRSHGLQKFIEHERTNENVPLGEGPFKRLVHKLFELRKDLNQGHNKGCPLHIGLVTARGLECSARVMTTLRQWGLAPDELIFAGGADKGPLLRAMGADFFFDDTGHNVRSAHEHNIASAQVPFGAAIDKMENPIDRMKISRDISQQAKLAASQSANLLGLKHEKLDVDPPRQRFRPRF